VAIVARSNGYSFFPVFFLVVMGDRQVKARGFVQQRAGHHDGHHRLKLDVQARPRLVLLRESLAHRLDRATPAFNQGAVHLVAVNLSGVEPPLAKVPDAAEPHGEPRIRHVHGIAVRPGARKPVLADRAVLVHDGLEELLRDNALRLIWSKEHVTISADSALPGSTAPSWMSAPDVLVTHFKIALNRS